MQKATTYILWKVNNSSQVGERDQNWKKNHHRNECPLYFFPSYILSLNLRGPLSLIVLWMQTAKTLTVTFSFWPEYLEKVPL